MTFSFYDGTQESFSYLSNTLIPMGEQMEANL